MVVGTDHVWVVIQLSSPSLLHKLSSIVKLPPGFQKKERVGDAPEMLQSSCEMLLIPSWYVNIVYWNGYQPTIVIRAFARCDLHEHTLATSEDTWTAHAHLYLYGTYLYSSSTKSCRWAG